MYKLLASYDSPTRFTHKIHPQDSPTRFTHKIHPQDSSTRKMFKTRFYNSKQAISPVIATILLLAITVIISVGVFQFLSQYTQDQLGQAQNNQILDDFNIRVIDSNAQESIIQTPFQELNITRVLLDGFECEGNIGVISGRPLRVNLSSCSQEITTNRPRLIIETEDGIIQRDLRSQDLGVNVGAGGVAGGTGGSGSSFDCSTLPGSWIEVPGSSYFGTDDFCVMQFEAKAYNLAEEEVEARSSNSITGFIPYSSSNSTPWVSITFNNARNACNQLNTVHNGFGGNFTMITNRQWMTIARNAELRAVNWDSGIQGSGAMFRGNSNGGSALDGTNSLSGINTRTLTLSNSEVIWDLAGNVWQWVDLMEVGTTFNGAACGSSNGLRSFFENDGVNACSFESPFAKTGASDVRFEMGPEGNFNANNGVGRIWSQNSEGRVLLRGGDWDVDGIAGAFAALLYGEPGDSDTSVGFRCAFEP